ncbi:E3 ubiquitin-protein ligase RNF166-like [Babylonia areolata]|uniref:E3 ubiquitin-protein ligase RNF166-like n=1 Tax=Babylonia areolata TaxID=304850 RepID=UPI003FCF9A7F
MSGTYATGTTNLDQFMCAVCMDIFANPTRIACGHGHVFCADCLNGLQPVDRQFLCPHCRTPFNPRQSVEARDIEVLMMSSYCQCKTCGVQMTAHALRKHMETCGVTDRVDFKFKPIKQTSQPVPQPGPNRSTFRCPYCQQANLDCKAMIEHCNSLHRHDPSQVVCPICTSMPWGDPTLRSTNFLQHLNTRHKFEYETYVDYDQDDEAMLRAALEASLKNQ